jgi:hypothetical protein
MAHPFHHAQRSAKLFGGVAEDYLQIHSWFDESKAHLADVRHRALRHHSEGIFMCERLFGVTIRNAAGREVPVRLIGEQHVKDDLGWIPTVKDWLSNLTMQPWMGRSPFRPTRDGIDFSLESEAESRPEAEGSEYASEPQCRPS